MKKQIAFVLALAVLFSIAALLTACGHKCEFETAWSKDATHHWHACKGEDCQEIKLKSEHMWAEGEITTPATQEAPGEKTYICSVCQATKTEPVAFTGFSEEEWLIALDLSQFENFAYTEAGVTEVSGITVATEQSYKLTKESAWVKVVMGENENEAYTETKEEVAELRRQIVDSLQELLPYDSFAYDAENKLYKATKEISLEALNTSTLDFTVSFSQGKLAKIEYHAISYTNGMSFEVNSTITLSEYGTVTLTPPAK